MHGCVALTTERTKVCEVESYARVGDVLGRDLGNVVDDLGGSEPTFGEALFAQTADLLDVGVATGVPSLGVVEGFCPRFHFGLLAKHSRKCWY